MFPKLLKVFTICGVLSPRCLWILHSSMRNYCHLFKQPPSRPNSHTDNASIYSFRPCSNRSSVLWRWRSVCIIERWMRQVLSRSSWNRAKQSCCFVPVIGKVPISIFIVLVTWPLQLHDIHLLLTHPWIGSEKFEICLFFTHLVIRISTFKLHSKKRNVSLNIIKSIFATRKNSTSGWMIFQYQIHTHKHH